MNNTKKEIIDTSINLFKKEGYSNVSLRKICDSRGITKGTFYYHFDSKEDLIFEYYNSISNEISVLLPEIAKVSSYSDKLWTLLEFLIDNTISLGAELLKALITADIKTGLKHFSPYTYYNESIYINSYDLCIEIIKQGQNQGTIRNCYSAELLIQTFISSLRGIILDWSSNSGSYDVKEELRKAFNVIFI